MGIDVQLWNCLPVINSIEFEEISLAKYTTSSATIGHCCCGRGEARNRNGTDEARCQRPRENLEGLLHRDSHTGRSSTRRRRQNQPQPGGSRSKRSHIPWGRQVTHLCSADPRWGCQSPPEDPDCP